MKRTFNLFILMTLIALAFSTLGVTSAQAGKSSAPSAAPITVLWSDNFESGYANWTMDGLWNAESDSDTCGSLIAPFPNPSNAAYYGQDGLCHYSTVDNNSGSLTMVNPVVLPGSGTLGMNFLNYQITEVSCGDFDFRLVDISTNGAGGPWTTLANLCTENTWHTASVDLSAYAGQSIHIRFRFDTVDSFANAYFGWMVDNVEIYIVGAPPTDTTPPVVTVPADITAEATSATGADVNFSASATDETSPANPTVSCNPASGSTFPIGTTQVDCQATDNANNTGHGYFNVTVQDKTPPVTYFDSKPPSLTNSTSATFTFHSTDAVSHPANIQHVCYVDSGPNWFNCSSPLNLNSLSEGYHVIWIYAADEAGNDNYATGLIAYGWMVDLTAPSFGLVADNPYEATGPGGANAAYNASFSDDNGVASGSCTPASGSLFPIGTTTVNCTGTDNAGNTANTSFGIQVVDSTAPTLNLPANITTPQTNPSGAVVSYIVTANDLVDASPNVSCTPASGSNFPLGTTTVNCSATDDYSNTSNGSFTVSVFSWTAASFTSVGAYDGTIFETMEASGVGGAPNISGGFLDVGDMTLDRQVKALMHFDTSTLPDGAVVLGLTLQLKRYQIVGTNPFTLLGDLNVDIASPYFGVEMAFRQGDFQATASEANVGTFNPAPLAGNWYEAMLGSSAFSHLNLTGPTQFRLHFTLDDNDDLQNDFIRFYSGNAPIAGYRPVLVVYYYIP